MREALGKKFKKLVRECFDMWWEENKQRVYREHVRKACLRKEMRISGKV